MKVLSDYWPNKIQLQMYLLYRFKSNDLIYKEEAIYKLFTYPIRLWQNTMLEDIWVFKIMHRFYPQDLYHFCSSDWKWCKTEILLFQPHNLWYFCYGTTRKLIQMVKKIDVNVWATKKSSKGTETKTLQQQKITYILFEKIRSATGA